MIDIFNLEKYNGKTSIIQWWLKFLTFINLQKLSEKMAINTLPFYLTEASESWFLDDTVKIHIYHQGGHTSAVSTIIPKQPGYKAEILGVGRGLPSSYHPEDHRPESPPQPASYSMNVTNAWNCLCS